MLMEMSFIDFDLKIKISIVLILIFKSKSVNDRNMRLSDTVKNKTQTHESYFTK